MSSSEALEGICRRLRTSDREAYEQVFRLLREDLLRYVCSIVRSGTVAHDLVQDVFVSLWGLRQTLDPSQPLKAYLYRMARNRAYRYLRDERLHARKHQDLQQAASEAAGPAWPDAAVDAGMLGHALHRWIEELPERQREALVLSRFHGLSHLEVASVMDISPRTVNNHIMRALNHLKERIQAFEPTLLDA